MNPPRTTTVALLGALALVLAACTPAASGSAITVADARVPVPAGVNAAAYMTLINDGDSTDQLISASTDIAGAVELHETTTEDGSMSMQQVTGVEIPADGQAVLEPGGLHVMLIGVTEDLTEGDTVDLTLTFEDAGERTVSAEVVPLGDVPAMDMSSEGMEMGSEPMDLGSES